MLKKDAQERCSFAVANEILSTLHFYVSRKHVLCMHTTASTKHTCWTTCWVTKKVTVVPLFCGIHTANTIQVKAEIVAGVLGSASKTRTSQWLPVFFFPCLLFLSKAGRSLSTHFMEENTEAPWWDYFARRKWTLGISFETAVTPASFWNPYPLHVLEWVRL